MLRFVLLLVVLLLACTPAPPPPTPTDAPEPTSTATAVVTLTAETPSALPTETAASSPTPTQTGPASPVPADTPTLASFPASGQAGPERVRVNGSGSPAVNMRREPGTNTAVVKSVPEGTEVTIVGTDREADGRIWRNVQDGDETGWIVATALRPLATPTVTPSSTAAPLATAGQASAPPQPSAAPAEPTATPQPERVEVFGTGGGGANLRAEPGTGGRIVQSLPDGTRLTVIGADREIDGRAWRNVRGESGTTGWIAAEVVRSLATPTLAGTATSAGTATPLLTSDGGTGTPSPTAMAPGAPPAGETPTAESSGAEPRPEPERVEVYGTGAQGANLRAQPGRSGSVLRSVPDGARLTIVGEDRAADGITWRNVQTDDGATGWLAVEVIRTLVTPTPTPRAGAPGIGAPLDEEEPEPEEQQTEEERTATPCRPGQIKGDATSGIYYPADHPEYAGLRQRVRCFDDATRARASGFRPPEPPAPSPEPAPE